MTHNLPIILVGPYPPNVGGVSTHLFRAVLVLEGAGFEVKVVSVNKLQSGQKNVSYITPFLLPIYLLMQKRSIVHFHVDSVNHLLVAWIIKVKHCIYLTVHNNRYPTTLIKKSIKNALKWRCLKQFRKIICVNSETQRFLSERLENINSEVVPAFLPPVDINDQTLTKIKQWGKSFDKILSGYAYRLSFYKGQDLYGIDMMITLMSLLKKRKINAGLVLLLNLEENDYLTEIKKQIKALELEDNINLIDINDGVDSVALWRYSDVYLRPTNTDGNSISVLEALTVGTPVVASDCVERPESCILFENRNVEDLCSKVLHSFNTPLTPATSNSPSIIGIYKL